MMFARTGLAALAAAVLYPLPRPAAVAAEEAAPVKPGKVEYNRDVRPILAENCFACHGADSAARKADLRLDRREDAVGGGAIVPGKPADSRVVDRIHTDESSEVMPPPRTKKALTAAQKETLRRWIEQGAEYQPHWSFLPSQRPAVPTFAGDEKAKKWMRTPVDAFVYAKLKEAGLEPAPEADRRALARRLSLDLVGLPPEPAAVEAFVKDTSPDYYEKYVDTLMASPQWGEHRGRYWLDAARYADTHGIHFDNFREVWAFRDWVIGAFNRNQPFDQFTVEQLAGDLLPDPTLDQRVASGFNRMNITTSEGGAIDEEYLVLYARDRTETASAVWMGLTTGCAVCHDHKYDPVTQKDFYALSAFFNNTTQRAMDGNVHNTPPILPVPKAEDRARWEALGKEVAAAKAKVEARKAAAMADFGAWLKTAKAADYDVKPPTKGLALHAPLTERAGKKVAYADRGEVRFAAFETGYDWSAERRPGEKAFTVKAGDSVALPDFGDWDKDQAFAVSAWVRVGKAGTTGAVVARMEEADGYRGWDVWLQNDRVATHVINTYPDDALKVAAKAPLPVGKWVHVTVTHDGTGKAAGAKVYYDGVVQPTDTENDTLKSSVRTKVPFKIGQRHAGQRAAGIALEDIRVYDRAVSEAEAKALGGSRRTFDLLALGEKRTPAEGDELFGWWLTAEDKPYRELTAAVKKLEAEEAAIKARGTIAHVMSEKPGEPTAYVLFRGDYDKRRDPVKADTPAALPPMGKDLPRNRLGLAKWLLSPDHPLTTRVTVNRFWQELYGNGLVKTSGDFGISGELPSHPELLDWLAAEFRTDWDVKRFFKLLVTSATYRQAAVATPDKLAKDRDNTLLSRGPRYRMDAEMVRDYALAASGLLVKKVGGPSVKPYQPTGVWEAVAMIGSNTRDYKPDAGDNLYRRSMYTFWKRAAPPAAMEVLNAPNRETCTVRRERTNTPLQALLTLNDVQYVEAARVLAEAALKSSTGDAGRLDFLARKLLARPFRPAEAEVVTATLADLREHYKAKPDDAKKLIAFGERKADPKLDPAELAAWAMLANQLLNLDEVLNK